jgi:hypothetical protein
VLHRKFVDGTKEIRETVAIQKELGTLRVERREEKTLERETTKKQAKEVIRKT